MRNSSPIGAWDLGRDVYLVGSLAGDTPSRRLRVDSRGNDSHSHFVEFDATANEQLAIYIGNHKLRSPRKKLEIELHSEMPLESFSLDGVLLAPTRMREEIKDVLHPEVPPTISTWLAHSSTGQVWSVVNEEQLLISDFPALKSMSFWRNQSVSQQAGQGTITPLLMTREWVRCRTTFGEVFVFNADQGDRCTLPAHLKTRVGGMCQIADHPLIAVGSSDRIVSPSTRSTPTEAISADLRQSVFDRHVVLMRLASGYSPTRRTARFPFSAWPKNVLNRTSRSI